jgi:hypothetical protein
MKTLRKTGRKFRKYGDLVYAVGYGSFSDLCDPTAKIFVSILEVCKLASSIANVELRPDMCTTYCCTDKLTHLWRLDNVLDVLRELANSDDYERLITILMYQVRLTYDLCAMTSEYDEVVFEEI